MRESTDSTGITWGRRLIGSLLVGLSFAKGLAFTHKLPIAAVDHIAAHIEAAFIENPDILYVKRLFKKEVAQQYDLERELLKQQTMPNYQNDEMHQNEPQTTEAYT